jgi:hypothetical protein
VASYVSYKDGERPPSATWIVPEGARYDDSGRYGEIVGYTTYGLLDVTYLADKHKTVDRHLLGQCVRLSQVIMKPGTSVSQYDRCLKQLLNHRAASDDGGTGPSEPRLGRRGLRPAVEVGGLQHEEAARGQRRGHGVLAVGADHEVDEVALGPRLAVLAVDEERVAGQQVLESGRQAH